MLGRLRDRWDSFAIGAARLDERLTRHTNRGAFMPYMPLAFLGIPFGVVGVYVMIGISVVAMFALPAYGRRVEATRPGLARPLKKHGSRVVLPREVRRRNRNIFGAVAIVGGAPLGIHMVRNGDNSRGWLLLAALAVMVVGFGMNAVAALRRRNG